MSCTVPFDQGLDIPYLSLPVVYRFDIGTEELPGDLNITHQLVFVYSMMLYVPVIKQLVPPTISDINPRKGSIYGGTLIEVAGDGFFYDILYTINFAFGGIPVTHLEVHDSTLIVFVTPDMSDGLEVNNGTAITKCLEGMQVRARGSNVLAYIIVGETRKTLNISHCISFDFLPGNEWLEHTY